MTVCGLVRLDGVDVRRASLTAMLASSSFGLPAARGVHLDGAFGTVTAADLRADPTPPIAVDDAGLVVIADRPSRRPEGNETAWMLAAAYRSGGKWALLRSTTRTVTIVWDPRRAQLVLVRPASTADELITWSDGRLFAFGTEADQVLSAEMLAPPSRLARLRRLTAGEVLTIAVPARLRRPAPAAFRLAGVDSDVS
ncbi:hypothetical protein [Frankia sp. CcWB3]